MRKVLAEIEQAKERLKAERVNIEVKAGPSILPKNTISKEIIARLPFPVTA